MTTNPLATQQREKKGAETFSKYDYQYHWALCRLLDEHHANQDYAIFVEYHEDVVLADWRWMDRIKTSPWYPSMRLFRQTDARRWDEPLEQMEQALKDFADKAKRPEATTSIFSAQECEVLKWYSAGKSQPEISQILNIAPRLVKFQLERSFKKLNVNNGRAAVHKAVSLGLIAKYGSEEG
jgi:DNA-binding CsgD family transcriptional regulator